MRTPINALLSEVIEAHGGLVRWRDFRTLSATIVTAGEFWRMKGLDQDANPGRTTIHLHREWGALAPLGEPDWHTEFLPQRVSIVARDGSIVADRFDPRPAFAGHTRTTPWDRLHRAYFNGYALWTYLNTPFVLADPGFEISTIPPIQEGMDTLPGLRALFPDRIATHGGHHDFYFGSDRLLRRHDYHVEVAGGFAATQLISDYVDVQGLRFPTRRRAYQRDANQRPRFQALMMSIDLSDFLLE